MNVSTAEKLTFYGHMGHSERVSQNVYQCPPGMTTLTKIGKFLHKIDQGQAPQDIVTFDELDVAAETEQKIPTSDEWDMKEILEKDRDIRRLRYRV